MPNTEAPLKRWKSIPFTKVRMEDGFWRQRLETLLSSSSTGGARSDAAAPPMDDEVAGRDQSFDVFCLRRVDLNRPWLYLSRNKGGRWH